MNKHIQAYFIILIIFYHDRNLNGKDDAQAIYR